MRIELLHHDSSNRRLILIFGGWSTAAPLYRHIVRKGWDTALVTDYSDLDFDRQAIAGYDTIYLYAWSMGVWGASSVLENADITMAFAVNGTPFPADDARGIPVGIFQGTAERLDERNLLKFRKRILGSSDASMLSLISQGSASVAELKEELGAILRMSPSIKSDSIRWRRAYIGNDDRIFPAENQVNAWNEISARAGTDIFRFDAPHYIDLKTIVDSTIPDMDKVGRRFAESLDTYDSAADAQTIIADRLSQRIDSMHLPSGARILEIGQGSGLLTRRYAPLLSPASIEFIDLYQMSPFGLAPHEIYHLGDAEVLLDDLGGEFDLILSGSTIQWFRNIPRFFCQAASLLAPTGRLVCSTFLPGTLDVLDAFRPSPMLYLPEDELKGYALRSFENVATEEETITLEFDSAKAALHHLRRTGVGGAFGRFGSLRQLISSLEKQGRPVKLRFNALYLVASSPK